jgi:alpha-2-macroglobulin
MTRTRTLIVIAASLLALVLTTLGAVAIADPDALRAALTRPTGAGGGTVVVPDTFLRRWDPVTIFFAADMGPSEGGPEDQPQEHVKFTPDHPGAFTWIDGRTLQFRPAEPWPALARFAWKAGGERVELATLMSPPSQTVPSAGSEGLDPVEAVTLTFSEPMDLATLARMVSIELRSLPGVGGPPERLIRRGDFELKAMERRGPSDSATYVLTLDEPIPLGTRATVRFELALDSEQAASFHSFDFSTAEPFRVASLGCSRTRYPVSPEGGHYAPEQAIRCDASQAEVLVDFSARPKDLGPVQGRSLVRFDPAVEGLEYRLQGQRLVVRADFERDTLYRVMLEPTALQDVRGRPLQLEGESSLWLSFPQQRPYLRMSAGQGIVERRGPQAIPMEGRGHERVDLRIYSIDPLERSFWPFPAQPVTVNEDDRPAGPGEEPEAFTDPNRSISPHQLAQQIDALGTPAYSDVVRLPMGPEAGAARFGLDISEPLAFVSGRGQPGSYLVGVRSLDGAATRAWMRVQVTDLALTTVEEPSAVVFVVSSLSTGRALAGATVRLEGMVAERGEPQRWDTIARGRTGSDGTFRWEAPGPLPRTSRRVRRIVVEREGDVLVMNADDPPERYSDNLWSGMHSTWLQWSLESLERRMAQPEDLCHLFTERPVYRPEQAVHIKGWARRRHQGELEPITSSGLLEIQGPGDQSWSHRLGTSGSGGFYQKFEEDKLPSGAYTATFMADRDEGYRGARCSVTWQMEAYRLPRFEVDLAAPERTALDREFEVKLDASYYAGGQVAGRPVRWRVTQYPYDYAPDAREGFLYSSDGRFGRGRRFETTPALDREVTTDGEGHDVLVLDPSVEPTAHPRTYVIEATVTGDDDQTVTATTRVKALPSFVLGLEVPRYLERASTIPVGLIAVGPTGDLITGQDVTVRLLHRQWHSRLQAGDFSDGAARYVTDIVDETVSEQVVHSAADVTDLSLPVERAGVYIVELESHDRLGRAQVVSVDLYVGGDEPVAWAKPAVRSFALTADKDRYRPGDKASIVFQSPYQKARALVIVEAPDGNRYSWQDVTGGTATARVAIEDTWTPRVPVHVVLMRGRIDDGRVPEGTDLDLGKPATVAATAWLEVEPVANMVQVELEHPSKARPGQVVDLTVELSDPDGRSVGGEVTLWLVDKAVLALGREQRLDPLPDFITPVYSRLGVLDTRNLVLGRLPLAEMPGGDGGEDEMGDGPLDKATVRRNFQPVPYYEPALVVPSSGSLTVKVQLPDNLTNFEIRAKVAAGPDRFGYGKGRIAVRLPVIVQPDLPRFVRPGDRFEATAIGRVVEGEGGPGKAEIQVEGLTLTSGARKQLELDAKAAASIGFPVTVDSPGYNAHGLPTRGEVSLTVGIERSADGAADAFQVSLPIQPDRYPVVERSLVELAEGDHLDIPALADAARPGTLSRTVLVSSEPGLVHVASGMDFLLQYPYGCTEQRISKARSHLALGQLGRLIHLERTPDEVDQAVNATIAWIGDAVDERGLVSFWPGSSGNTWLTSWTVLFLVDAQEAGYAVDAGLMSSLVRSLKQALRSDYPYFLDGEAWEERAWALAALAAAGEFDRAYFAELGRKASTMDAEGVSQVLIAGARAGQQDSPTSEQLVEKLSAMMVVRLHQGQEIYGGLQGQRSSRSGLILPGETRTLASMARALARVAPDHERLPVLYDAIVTLGRTDGWGSTNANAAAMLAIAERLKQPRKGAPTHNVALHNGGQAETVRIDGTQPVAFWSLDDAGALVLTHVDASGRDAGALIVRSDAFYLPAKDGSHQPARADGFVVQRSLERVLGGTAPSEKLPIDAPSQSYAFVVGEVIEDHVRVVVPEDRHHVAIVVPIAAGMEPLNPALATAPPEATPSAGPTRAPSYADYADDHVAFFYDHLPKGSYDFRFRVRAFTPGSYTQPAARAEMMYDASTVGTSPGARIEIARD